MNNSLILDILYFIFIEILYKNKLNAVVTTILYYTINIGNKNGNVNRIHHILSIFILFYIRFGNSPYDINITNTFIVKYNRTTFILLLLRYYGKYNLNLSRNRYMVYTLFLTCVYYWIKIRILWTIKLNQPIVIPFLSMNIYWLILIFKRVINRVIINSKKLK